MQKVDVPAHVEHGYLQFSQEPVWGLTNWLLLHFWVFDTHLLFSFGKCPVGHTIQHASAVCRLVGH